VRCVTRAAHDCPIRLSARPSRRDRPNSYPAATDVAALVNCGWLLILEMFVVAAAAYRLITHTPQVHGLPVLVVNGAAALIMTVGALILRGDADDSEEEANERDLSVAAVLLDTVADAAAAAGVAATGLIILATEGWYWLDPAVALINAVIIAYHALALLRRIRSRLQSAAATAN
jgi:cobalt-zinc-cadmium efflux system protein